MPNMDGPTAVKKMREMGFTGAIFGVTGAFAVAVGDMFCMHTHTHVLTSNPPPPPFPDLPFPPGNVLPSDVQHFLSQGADIVLGKPLKISELKAAIRAYTRKQRELATLRQEEEQQLQGTNLQALEHAATALGTDDNV